MANRTDGSGDDRGARNRRWPKTAKFLIGLLTAIGVFLGGLSGFLGLSNANLQQANAKASAKVSSAQTVIVNLQGDKSELQTKYQTLSSQAAAAPGDTAAPTGDVLPTGVTPRHDDPALTIQSGQSADLDSPPSNPRWDDGDGTNDLYFRSGVISASYPAKILALPTGTEATYKACNASGFSNTVQLSVRDTTTAGDSFCMQTSSNRIAALKITKLDDTIVVLSVRVWNTGDSQ